jgi:hypothetical protein
MKWERSSCVFAPRKAAVYLLLMGSLSCEQREFPSAVTLHYGQEVSLRKGDKLKLVGIWDARADSLNTTYIYMPGNFGVKLKWVEPDASEEFSMYTWCYVPDDVRGVQGSFSSNGYRFSLHSVLPAPWKNIPLEEYEVTMVVSEE